ncbi:hypothetical protein TeGR_g14044 [Tetraparma gracilis]|uniref:Uncharacterized protein n=1 Tax=Tetraparma gracilis TaxID=2962635 RepID=A0ABQ6MCT1_9STRA|nr:hypothetical protein TeGR_g14044 [Tetraparma gracilis]
MLDMRYELYGRDGTFETIVASAQVPEYHEAAMGLFMNITTHHDRVTNERMINDFTPITKFIISSLSSNNKEVRSCTQRCFLHMTVNEGTHEPMRSNPELMLALCDAKHAETPHCARTLYNICDYGRFSALSALSALSVPISEPPLDLLFFCSRSYRFHDSIVLAMIREFPEQLTKSKPTPLQLATDAGLDEIIPQLERYTALAKTMSPEQISARTAMLELIIKDEEGNEESFVVKRTDQLQKLFDAYRGTRSNKGFIFTIVSSKYQYVVGPDAPVLGSDRPDSFALEDGDTFLASPGNEILQACRFLERNSYSARSLKAWAKLHDALTVSHSEIPVSIVCELVTPAFAAALADSFTPDTHLAHLEIIIVLLKRVTASRVLAGSSALVDTIFEYLEGRQENLLMEDEGRVVMTDKAAVVVIAMLSEQRSQGSKFWKALSPSRKRLAIRCAALLMMRVPSSVMVATGCLVAIAQIEREIDVAGEIQKVTGVVDRLLCTRIKDVMLELSQREDGMEVSPIVCLIVARAIDDSRAIFDFDFIFEPT